MLVLVTDVDRHRHSGLRLTQRHRLRFTQLGPVALVRFSFARMPVRKLHEVEREIMTPRTSPVANHEWKQRAVLISTPGVALALVPDRRHESRTERAAQSSRCKERSDCFDC